MSTSARRYERRRRKLPPRRMHDAVTIVHRGVAFSVGIGRYGLTPGDPVGEVFIDAAKAGSEVSTLSHDAATIISIAIQYGTPLSVLASAVARLDGLPQSAIGAVLDLLVREDGP